MSQVGNEICKFIRSAACAQPTGGNAAFMDAVRPFVDCTDPRIPPNLFQAIFVQIAITAEDLDAEVGRAYPCLLAKDFAQRGQEITKRGAIGSFDRHKGDVAHRARAQSKVALVVQHALNVCVLVEQGR